MNKSALTDGTTTENHEIDWEQAKVIDKEGHKRKRHVLGGHLDKKNGEEHEYGLGQL